MRILFVGDYDMAGAAIATRQYREGDRVCWLTREGRKDLWARPVSGRVFRRDITYSAARQILQGESVDCLVFLTAPWRERYLEEDDPERPSLLSQMEPVLRACAGLKLKRVCMISSLDLGEEGLLTPALEELRAGERVLRACCREEGLPLLILRVGCLFGKAAAMEDAGFAGQAARDMARGRKVRCPFAADAEFDFLRDADLADAAYRMLDLDLRGIYDVVFGRPTTAARLYELAASAVGYRGGVEFGGRAHSCRQARGQPLRDACGWMPFHALEEEEGLEFPAGGASEEGDGPGREGKRPARARRSLLAETGQNLLLFAAALLVSSLTAGWSDLRYVDVRLLYVIVVAITFGMRQGLLATALAILSYLVTLVRSQIDISYVLYSVESWIPFIVYGVAGAFGGYWSDRKNDEYDGLQNEYREQGERYAFLKELYRDVVEVKNNLQKQIVISRDSLGHLYAITRELGSLSPRAVCLRTIRVMEEVMECRGAALYILSRKGDGFCRLVACSAPLSARLAASLDLRDYPKLREAVEGKRLYVNTELDQDYPAFAMPILDGEEAVALAVLYELAPDRYTSYYRNLFETLVRMIQDNLSRAFRHQRENWDKIYLPGTAILSPEGFEAEWESFRRAREEYNNPFSAARITASAALPEPRELYQRLAPLLRGTDLLGVRADGSLWVIFVYANRDSRPILERRFADNGFSLEWED